jgi:filamentous hemagglutinin
VLGNLAGGVGLPKNQSQNSATSSVIQGNVTLTGANTGDKAKDEQLNAASQSTATTLTSRDAATANESLKNTLSLQDTAKLAQVQQTAKENAQAGQLVGSVAFNIVGDIAAKNKWEDASPQKIALHGIAGLIQAKVGGISGLVGAGAAMTNEAFTKKVNEYIEGAVPMPANATPDQQASVNRQRKDLAEAAAGVMGAAAAAMVGGNSQAAQQGATIGMTADRFNRLLHEDEKARIKRLAGGDASKQAALAAASCALVKCSAEFAEGSAEHAYWKAIENLGNTPALKDERELLKAQDGLFVYKPIHKGIDAAKRIDDTYQVVNRGLGAVQAVGGGLGVAAGLTATATGVASCVPTSGAGCGLAAGGVALTAYSADHAAAGAITVWSGAPTPTLGGTLIGAAFGISPEAGELLYGLAGLAPVAVNGVKILLGAAKPTAVAVASKIDDVADETTALNRITSNPNGANLTAKAPNTVSNQQAVNGLADGKIPGN